MLTAIAEEMRVARERAGLTQEELAEKINFSQSYISKVERGQLPSMDLAKACDEALGLDGLLQRHVRRELRSGTTPPALRDWIEVERGATTLRAYHPNLIPGLLQTEDYARSLVSADPWASPDEVDRRVSLRLERQSILVRTQLVAVLDEAALRREVADPAIMRHQVLSLLERPVELQVIELGAHLGVNGPLMIASYDGTDLAYIEGQLGGTVVERRDDLLEITKTWETLRGEALNRRKSLELIKEVAETWKP